MPKNYAKKRVYENPDTVTSVHHADMMLLGCVDFRLWPDLAECFKGMDLRIDLRLTEGGICYLCGHKHGLPHMQKGSVEWLQGLQGLHNFHTVGLMIHDGCGAYKTAPLLIGKTTDEISLIQLEDLEEAEELVRQALPDITVRKFHMVLHPSGRGVTIEELVEADSEEELDLAA